MKENIRQDLFLVHLAQFILSHPQHLTFKMPITSEAGKAFAAKFLQQFAAGFPENNHAATLDVSPKREYDGCFFMNLV
jgi:hypothetical protein